MKKPTTKPSINAYPAMQAATNAQETQLPANIAIWVFSYSRRPVEAHAQILPISQMIPPDSAYYVRNTV